jgi:hypothetical protein
MAFEPERPQLGEEEEEEDVEVVDGDGDGDGGLTVNEAGVLASASICDGRVDTMASVPSAVQPKLFSPYSSRRSSSWSPCEREGAWTERVRGPSVSDRTSVATSTAAEMAGDGSYSIS